MDVAQPRDDELMVYTALAREGASPSLAWGIIDQINTHNSQGEGLDAELLLLLNIAQSEGLRFTEKIRWNIGTYDAIRKLVESCEILGLDASQHILEGLASLEEDPEEEHLPLTDQEILEALVVKGALPQTGRFDCGAWITDDHD